MISLSWLLTQRTYNWEIPLDTGVCRWMKICDTLPVVQQSIYYIIKLCSAHTNWHQCIFKLAEPVLRRGRGLRPVRGLGAGSEGVAGSGVEVLTTGGSLWSQQSPGWLSARPVRTTKQDLWAPSQLMSVTSKLCVEERERCIGRQKKQWKTKHQNHLNTTNSS